MTSLGGGSSDTTVDDPDAPLQVGGRPLTLAADAFDKPRRFLLNRAADPSGTTGVGAVAWGTLYPDGWVSVCWQTAQRVRSWYETIDDVMHLHGAATSFEWLDV